MCAWCECGLHVCVVSVWAARLSGLGCVRAGLGCAIVRVGLREGWTGLRDCPGWAVRGLDTGTKKKRDRGKYSYG